MDNPEEKQYRKGMGFLAQHGATLIENGYNIIPIPPGNKGPVIDGWESMQATSKLLAKWIDQGWDRYGIGINAKNTPGVDIDVTDEEFAEELQAKAFELWGEAPIRVGKAPKRLLLYRTDVPFRKITSKTFYDEWGDRCRLEILCDGQQFVAFHIHPDTHQPYRWISETDPLDVAADDLPLFEVEKAQELIDFFEQGAEERGWEESRGSKLRRLAKTGEVDRNDPFAADAHPVNMSQPELQQRLMMVPGAEDYEVWLQVGMALFHQYAGEDIGREMWHEWSESADNYEPEVLDRKWKSFDISDKKRAPVTARLILQLAKDAAETKAIETATDLRDKFATARDRAEWNDAAKMARRAEIDHISRASLAEVARESLQKITGAKVPLPEVKKALAYEINTKELPRWCRDWVYDVSDDRFYHTETKATVSAQGFNAMHDRHSMTKKDVLDGKTSPMSSAVDLALNVYKIPTVNGRMYAPGRDAIFIYNDTTMANTYPENQVPEKPKSIRPVDKINIKRVKRHLAHLLPDEKQQLQLLDWLAYVVQNPGKRVNYAPLIQGVQGDGKSFFAFLLAACMGAPNVRMGNAHILEGSFTGWAQGQCVMAIEEIRLIGHNRFDVLNRLKPLITNKVIEIHPKGRDPYNVDNTTNYILFSNYRDAMPLSPNERRFLVLFSQWQNADDLRAFTDENPDYYTELYGALEESAQALRYWLLQHDLSEDFNPMGNAPITAAFDHMVKSSQPSEVRAINEMIESGEHFDICESILNVTALQSLTMSSDVDIPAGRGLEKALEIAGFWPLGRVRIGDERCRFYSKTPEVFQSNVDGEMVTDAAKIKRWIKEHEPPEEDDDW